jgi:hypothetical protein
MTTKQCKTCHQTLQLICFNKNKRCKDDLDNRCRECTKKRYEDRREEQLESQRKWREKNRDYPKQYVEKNADKVLEYRKTHYENNKQKSLEYTRQWRRDNPEKYRNARKNYIESNREQVNQYHREWKLQKRNTDVHYKLRENMSRRIRYELNTLLKGKKTKRTCEYLQCDLDFLKVYLESKFEYGMNWKNYGKVWHIDHIVPCTTWDLPNTFDTFCCWNYRNLQPLWAFENHSKKDKFEEDKKLYYKTYIETLLI